VHQPQGGPGHRPNTGETEHLTIKRLLNAFPHLRNVRFATIDAETVSLLTGADVPEALRVLVRHGQGRSPDAIKTPLGWLLLGPAF